MKIDEALVTLTDEVYVPTFVKAAAEAGLDMSNPKDLANALEISAVLNTIKQSEQNDTIKSAHDMLLTSAGLQVDQEPAPAPAAQPVGGRVKQALDALKSTEACEEPAEEKAEEEKSE
tara:strand:- start:34 stop:387 length:354 start_codon:yes stop_codon:yes gene_type:complete